MSQIQWPTPAQIGVYLTAHGWRFARPMKRPGTVYAYHQPSDDGNPVELFVPHFDPRADAVEDFASSVLAVADTVRSFEERSWQAVLADMLATEVAPAPVA